MRVHEFGAASKTELDLAMWADESPGPAGVKAALAQVLSVGTALRLGDSLRDSGISFLVRGHSWFPSVVSSPSWFAVYFTVPLGSRGAGILDDLWLPKVCVEHQKFRLESFR